MDLKDFVSETIVQISQGIMEAQEKTKEYGTIVNPELIPQHNDIIVKDNTGMSSYPARFLDFDILVNIEKTGSTETKGKIGVYSCFMGKGGKQLTINENVSRIKFSIPVLFPFHDFWKSRDEKKS